MFDRSKALEASERSIAASMVVESGGYWGRLDGC